MDTLDLHGIRHREVDRLVENFVLLRSLPVRIIVGNSARMRELTLAVIKRHDLQFHYENDFNLGSLVILAD